MDKISLKPILFLLLFLLYVSSIAWAQLSEKALIKKWETIQRSDPKTVVFEKIEERRYKFKTEWFTFDGELKILGTRVRVIPGGYITGIVEIELVDIQKKIREKYIYSYSKWAENNTLYFDTKTKKWLSQKERLAIEAQRTIGKSFPSVLSPKESSYRKGYWNYFDHTMVFFILIIIVLGYILMKIITANKNT